MEARLFESARGTKDSRFFERATDDLDTHGKAASGTPTRHDRYGNTG